MKLARSTPPWRECSTFWPSSTRPIALAITERRDETVLLSIGQRRVPLRAFQKAAAGVEMLVSAAAAAVPGDCHRLQGHPLRIDAAGAARGDWTLRVHHRGNGGGSGGASCAGELPRLICARAGRRPAVCTFRNRRLRR